MRGVFVIFMFAIVVALAGCSEPVPKCGDEQATNLVKDIAGREMANQLGQEAASQFTYSVNAIRTTDTNQKTGAYSCAADLQINAKNGQSNSIPITYSVERTDDGKNIYVNVLGLR